MRRSLLLLLAAFSIPLAAQQAPDRPLTLSLLITDVSFTESDSSGSNLDAGMALGLRYMATPRWSVEASIGREETEWRDFVLGSPELSLREIEVTSYPVEVVAQWNFRTGIRWKPYLGAGLRYVPEPSNDPENSGDLLAPVITGGVSFNLTDSFSLRAEGKAKIGDDRYYDDHFKTAIGVGWRF
jgi:opacity protein-like surface antigen